MAAGSRREGPAWRRHCALSTSGEGPSSAHPRLHPTLTPSSGERTSLPSPVGDGGLSPRPSPRTPLLERSWVGPQPPQPEAAPLGWCLARPAVLLSDACGEAAGPRPAVQPGDLWAERPPGPGWLAGVGSEATGQAPARPPHTPERTCVFIAHTCLPCCQWVLSDPRGTFVLVFPEKIKFAK